MSKILVVEPRRMLQQAIALVLIPEHEVRLSAAIPKAEDAVIQDYDILIVDAVALTEQDSLSGKQVGLVEQWGMPTIWIKDKDMGCAPKHDRLFTVKSPIEKGAILSAVAECLKLPGVPADTDTVAPPRALKDHSRTRPENKESEAAGAGAPLIELVDVIEEEPTTKK